MVRPTFAASASNFPVPIMPRHPKLDSPELRSAALSIAKDGQSSDAWVDALIVLDHIDAQDPRRPRGESMKEMGISKHTQHYVHRLKKQRDAERVSARSAGTQIRPILQDGGMVRPTFAASASNFPVPIMPRHPKLDSPELRSAALSIAKDGQSSDAWVDALIVLDHIDAQDPCRPTGESMKEMGISKHTHLRGMAVTSLAVNRSVYRVGVRTRPGAVYTRSVCT